LSQLAEVPLPEVRTNSCLAAPITDGAHPVVVFTHGYTGTFTDYTFVFEDLASRGYVVASVDHTYEATAMEFPDGRLAKSAFGSYLIEETAHRDEQALFEAAVSARLSDLKFVVNQIERLNAEPDGPFTGKLDTTRIAIAGHSLGGLTALFAMEQEPRFRAAIVIDGAVPDMLPKTTETPVLFLAAGREQWTDGECFLWDQFRGPRLAVSLQGAEHLTTSDAIWLAEGAVKTGVMGPEKTIAAVRSYIFAFLEANLRGKAFDSLLRGPSADYPDAAVTPQEKSPCSEAVDGSRR
jgi:dienelactone hydrolase